MLGENDHIHSKQLESHCRNGLTESISRFKPATWFKPALNRPLATQNSQLLVHFFLEHVYICCGWEHSAPLNHNWVSLEEDQTNTLLFLAFPVQLSCIYYVWCFARGRSVKFSRCCNNQRVYTMDRPVSSANFTGQKPLHCWFLYSGAVLDLTYFHQTQNHALRLGRVTKLCADPPSGLL